MSLRIERVTAAGASDGLPSNVLPFKRFREVWVNIPQVIGLLHPSVSTMSSVSDLRTFGFIFCRSLVYNDCHLEFQHWDRGKGCIADKKATSKFHPELSRS